MNENEKKIPTEKICNTLDSIYKAIWDISVLGLCTAAVWEVFTYIDSGIGITGFSPLVAIPGLFITAMFLILSIRILLVLPGALLLKLKNEIVYKIFEKLEDYNNRVEK